jgi:hypothetical protein
MAAKKKIKVKDRPDLVRDSFSKAIINVDRNGFAQYKARKKLLKAKDDQIKELKSQVADILKQQEEILKLLKATNK